MKNHLLILLFVFIGATAMHPLVAQTYDPYAVQVINNLIANNGLNATPNAPETWEFATWNDETPKKIIELQLNVPGGGVGYMNGVASFAELTALQILNCNWGYLTKIDVTNCTQLKTLSCKDNSLTEIDLTNCMQLQTLYCGQNMLTKLAITHCTQLQTLNCWNNNLIELDLTGLNKLTDFFGSAQSPPPLTLYENEAGEYTLAILLNNPTFTDFWGVPCSTISYSEGILKSTDNTVVYPKFTMQTNKDGFELSGTMALHYSNVGINPVDSVELNVYPNPANGKLIVTSRELRATNIEIFDANGRKQKAESRKQKAESEIVMDILHFPAGIYFVKIITEQGNVIKKIIKQ